MVVLRHVDPSILSDTSSLGRISTVTRGRSRLSTNPTQNDIWRALGAVMGEYYPDAFLEAY
jgi:hypothetical protein